MSIHGMIHHPLISAAITREGLDHAEIERRLEGGSSYSYGGSPLEGVIMTVSINAHPDTIGIRYVTQRGEVIRVIKRHTPGASLEVTDLPPETWVNAMADRPLSDVVALPGGEGLTVRSAQIVGAELRLTVT